MDTGWLGGVPHGVPSPPHTRPAVSGSGYSVDQVAEKPPVCNTAHCPASPDAPLQTRFRRPQCQRRRPSRLCSPARVRGPPVSLESSRYCPHPPDGALGTVMPARNYFPRSGVVLGTDESIAACVGLENGNKPHTYSGMKATLENHTTRHS